MKKISQLLTLGVALVLAGPLAEAQNLPTSAAIGGLRAEYFTNITGTLLTNLTSHGKFLTNAPDIVELATQFESRSEWAENYGARLSGWLIPPTTGNYRFYLASDDQGALFLSTDATAINKTRIAFEPQWNGAREFITGQNQASRGTPATNISANIALVAGNAYYVEAQLKEGSVGDHLAVAWLPPGGPAVTNGAAPIPGIFLASGTPYVGGFQPLAAASLTNSGQIGVNFGRLLDQVSATVVTTNYEVIGATVTGVMLSPDRQGVLLSVSGLAGSTFTLWVGAVKDVFGNSSTPTQLTGLVLPQFRQDVGTGGDPAVAGTTFSSRAGEFDVAAGGSDIWVTGDHFHFVHEQLTGDFDVRVRVESLEAVNRWSKAGLMVRESLAANSRNLMALVESIGPTRDGQDGGQGQNEYFAQFRPDLSGATVLWMLPAAAEAPPYPNAWLRLKRQANSFSAYRGSDGITWTLMGQTNQAYPATVYVGLATTSHNNVPGYTTLARYRSYESLLNLPPLITAQPQSVQTLMGSPATFQVTASGTPPLSYQWRMDGVDLPAATNLSYFLPPVTPFYRARSYTVVVSNYAGSVTSAPAMLTVNPLSPGEVVGWGSNSYGQVTVPEGARSGVIRIAAGLDFTLALKADGSVVAWGDNSYGQTTVPAAAQSGVVAISAGGSHSVALKVDGTVVAWGRNIDGETTVPVAAQSGVEAIAAGVLHTVALKNSGLVVAWGDNSWGQTTIPAAAQGGVVAIAAGLNHTVALKSNGSVVAWGDNSEGQTTVPSAAQSGVVAIAAGNWRTVVLKNDGSVIEWGKNRGVRTIVSSEGRMIAAGGEDNTAVMRSGGNAVSTSGGSPGHEVFEGRVAAVAVGWYHWVIIAAPAAPAITEQPVNQTIDQEHSSCDFTVTAWGSFPFSYQWRKDGMDLSGATNSAYYFDFDPLLIETNEVFNYTVVVSNAFGSVTSTVAVLTIIPAQRVDPAVRLSIRKISPGIMKVEWTAPGFSLDSALTVRGPWQEQSPPANEYTISPADSSKFFRLRNGPFLSSNVVGCISLLLRPGLNLIQNPLDASAIGGNVVSNALAGVPDGTTAYRYSNSPAGGGFVVNDYTTKFRWTDPNMSMAPGESFFVWLPPGSDFTNVFIGEVMQGHLVVNIPAGLSLVGSQVPQAGRLTTDLNFPAGVGSEPGSVSQWNPGSRSYLTSYFMGGVGWVDFVDPFVRMGEGFWLDNRDGVAFRWDRDFQIVP